MIAKLRGALNRRRPFPLRLAALAHCRVSYSQFGEDLFIQSLLPEPTRGGFYVDVGCYRPVQFSNTYRLYQLGWRGLAIDASQRWQREWSSVRPRDTFIVQPIAEKAKPMLMCFDNVYPTCSRLIDPAGTPNAPELRDPRYTITEITAKPLSDVLTAHVAPENFDFLNVDCEGLDLQVLASLDLRRYKPRVIAVEDHDVTCESETSRLLCSYHYRLAAMIGYTKVFERAPCGEPRSLRTTS